MYNAPGRCPVCDSQLYITSLCCENCNTEIHGEFKPCEFCRLDDEMRLFLLTFVRNRGNIKEVEKELDISYPTVRSRLDKVIELLTPEAEDNNSEEIARQRRAILAQLDRGEINAEAAAALLNELERK